MLKDGDLFKYDRVTKVETGEPGVKNIFVIGLVIGASMITPMVLLHTLPMYPIQDSIIRLLLTGLTKLKYAQLFKTNKGLLLVV